MPRRTKVFDPMEVDGPEYNPNYNNNYSNNNNNYNNNNYNNNYNNNNYNNYTNDTNYSCDVCYSLRQELESLKLLSQLMEQEIIRLRAKKTERKRNLNSAKTMQQYRRRVA